MAEVNHEDDQLMVTDGIHDAVAADTEAKQTGMPGERLDAGGARISGQAGNGGYEAA